MEATQMNLRILIEDDGISKAKRCVVFDSDKDQAIFTVVGLGSRHSEVDVDMINQGLIDVEKKLAEINEVRGALLDYKHKRWGMA